MTNILTNVACNIMMNLTMATNSITMPTEIQPWLDHIKMVQESKEISTPAYCQIAINDLISIIIIQDKRIRELEKKEKQ